MKNVSHDKIKITDGFWRHFADLDRSSIVHSVYDRFLETGRFDALRCDWKEGMPNRPHIFWDSDVFKWIEGVAYLIEESPEPHLEKLCDGMIENVAKNQRADGYFNSYYLAIEPENIYSDRACHELYCTGHMIEAAIAYHRATGKDTLLSCALQCVDLIYKVFFEEQSASFVTPGHQEIELALLKLYRYLGDEKHLRLARFFIDMRGANEKDIESIEKSPLPHKAPYYQSHIPVREFTEAEGHAVRACYLYTAMALLAKEDSDASLLSACRRVFEDIISSKMSITGGIGADHKEEKFSYKYNLPNRDTYNETCAAIALALFAGAMQETEPDSRYADLIERIYYNGFIAGVSLKGDEFFYSIPLEFDKKKYGHSTHQCPGGRSKYFDCSCCPPNVVRMLASVPRYTYSTDGDTVYCHQFMSCTAELEGGTLIQKTDYPYSGKVSFEYSGKPITLKVRIPDWCTEYEGEAENGYISFELKDGDTVSIDFPMKVHFIEANPYVQENSGRYAIQYGPLVYCMEEIDNGENLRDITLIENGNITIEKEDGIPAPVLYMDALRRPHSTQLYKQKNTEKIPFRARLIPYFAFANRGETDMLIWTMIQ